MLVRFLFVLFSLNLFSLKCLGQEIDEEFKQQILSYLTSKEGPVVIAATEYIIICNLVEAIPVLDSIIWHHNLSTQLSIIWALAYLNSQSTQQIALAFIDSVDQYSLAHFRDDENKLSAKAHVNLALFYIHDYSQADFVMQQLRINPFDDQSLWLLPDIIQNLTQYENEAKNLLINAANNAPEYRIKDNALHNLEKLYGSEMIPLYVKFFKNVKETGSEFSYSRIRSFEYLCKYNYHDLENLIKEQLYVEPAASYKIDFVEVLLERFKTEENIKFIEEFCNSESDELVINSIGFILEKIKDDENSKE